MKWLKAPATAGALLFLLLTVLGSIWKLSSCHLYGWDLGREVRYSAINGCVVKMPVGWTPRAEIRTEQ